MGNYGWHRRGALFGAVTQVGSLSLSGFGLGGPTETLATPAASHLGRLADPTTSTSWWVRPMAPVPVTLPAALRDHGVKSLPADLALIRKVGSEPINEASLAVIDGALPL